MPVVEVFTIVEGPIKETYQIASDMESFPKFMEDVLSVKVIERQDNWTITEWVTKVDGRIIKWREKDFFDKNYEFIKYEQIKGDLKRFCGQWTFTETTEGIKVALTVDFDLGIPMLSALLNPILRKKVYDNSISMLKAVKEQVESEGLTEQYDTNRLQTENFACHSAGSGRHERTPTDTVARS